MCAPWDTGCMADKVASAVSDSIFGQISAMVITAEEWLISVSASWWVMVPSISLYPDANNTNPDAAPIDAVANLRALIMPITLVVAVGGMLWNGLLMVLSRKPAPLVNVMRGLWNTALWAAVSIFGTQLLLAGTDAFATYIISTALKSAGAPSLGNRLGALLVPVGGGAGGLPVGVVILVGAIASFCAFIQALLMLFRDGSVLILAAVTPLAASGSFANATNGWKNKILSWQLALIFYKAVAAMVYATMIWLTNDSTARDPRVLLFGMAMMIIALIALPVLMRLFNWTVGTLQSGGGGFGMFATAGAAGAHAAASLRGTGPMGVNEHSRYIADTFGGPSSGGSASPSGSGTPGSPPPAPPGGTPGAVPRFQGPPGGASPGSTAPGGVPMPAPTVTPQSGTGAGEGREGSQAVMGVVNAGTGVVEGVAPLAGPAAPVVLGAAQVVRTGAQMANSAANSMADAADNSSKGG